MATKSFIKTIGSKGLLADYNTSGKKLQTELTAGNNITIAGDTISSNQVFVATYGTTTYQEIKDAYDAGKICTVFKDRKRCYNITEITNEAIKFGSVSQSPTIYTMTVTRDNKWTSYDPWLQQHLTFDSAPKDGSNNPVTSDGIKKELDKKQNSMTAGDNITIDSDTISSNQVFVATYGTTKYAEIKAAYDAGKICTVYYASRYYYMIWINRDYIEFMASNESNTLYHVSVSSGSKWVSYTSHLQSKLTFDSAPKAGSNNPVTSDGIKTALDSRIPAPTSTTGTQVLKCIDGVIQWVTE